ncbi:MAG: hypothetical protein LBG90_02070 [Spirochaetaceae bacterium]|jgi:hypothetical protein|nr:hypothetical protein [Spirochaetaceae bacterium]
MNLYVDETIKAEILELLPDSGAEDIAHIARYLFRVGVSSEREQRSFPAQPVQPQTVPIAKFF